MNSENLKAKWLLKTHIHADHLSTAPYLQEKLDGKIGICEMITRVQDTIGKIFNEGTDFERNGSQFDQLLKEGDTLKIGHLSCDVVHTSGHTPACVTFLIDNAAFVGDTLFMPDFGTARTNFPDSSAENLFTSIQKSWPFRKRPEFSLAMTTKHRGVRNMPRKQLSASN